MIDYLLSYQPLFNQVLVYSLLGYSQYIVLRAGVFSVATVGIAAIGAYASGIATVKLGMPPLVAVALSMVLCLVVGLLIAIPLSRLRGVYQAIATMAMVQVVASLIMYAESLTGGVLGLSNIQKGFDTPGFLLAVGVVIWLLHCLNRSGTGRAFDAIRNEETVAVSLGISVTRYQAIAFGLSGLVAGLAGSLIAFYGRSLFPSQFGFHLLTEALAFVVLGGTGSVFGPLVGAIILIVVPDFARSLADNTLLFYGAVLILSITYLPHGVMDTIALRRARGRRARIAAAAAEKGETDGFSPA